MSFKNTLTAAAVGLSLLAGAANAGNLAEPMMEPEVIAEESTSSGGFVLPLLLLAIIVAIASSSSGGGGGGGGPALPGPA